MSKKIHTVQQTRNEQAQAALAEEPTLASISASAAEREQFNDDVQAILKNRAAEHARLAKLTADRAAAAASAALGDATLPRLAANVTVVKKVTTPVAALQKFIDVKQEADRAIVAADQQDVSEIAAPLASEARSLATSYGILRDKYREAVAAAASLDMRTLEKTLPYGVTVSPRNPTGTSTPIFDALNAYQALAVSLDGGFNAGKNYHGAGGEPTFADDLHRAVTSMVHRAHAGDSPDFRTDVRHVQHHLMVAREQLRNVESLIVRFVDLSARIEAALVGVEPRRVEGEAPREYLPPIPAAPPAQSATSYTSFDPREPEQQINTDPLQVTPLGSGDGYRVSGHQPVDKGGPRPSETKIVGVAR